MAAGLAAILSVVLFALSEATRDLAIIPWAGLAIYALADLVQSLSRGRRLFTELSDEMFIGETTTLTLRVENAPANLHARLDWPDGLSGPKDIVFDPVGESVSEAKVEIQGVRRGVWQFERLWLNWPSRYHLFEFVPKMRLEREIRVVPNVRVVNSGEITSTVQSGLYGIKENRVIGEGSEFHQLRDYVAGMDTRTIDWKRSARRRALVAREMRSERNHHVIIALDCGYLMREEIAGIAKIDHAVTAALATTWAAIIGGDLVGLYAYDAVPQSFAKPEGGRATFSRIRSLTAEIDYSGRETNHTLALSELSARTPKRSLLIVFTDFVDTTSAELLVENLGLLAKRHLMIFIAIRDPEVEALLNSAPADLDGMATLVSANQTLSERRLVLERLSRLGIMVVDARPDRVTPQLISTYLDIKARELI